MSEEKAMMVEPAGGSIKVSQKPPTRADLARVADIKLYDAKREEVRFGSLLSTDPKRRTLVVFIRHFFCGNCQEYLRTLCSSITTSALAALPQPTSVIVIGHGQPDLISFYAEVTACPFPIYAEPTKRIYAELGMGRTLDLGPSRPEYMQRSMPAVMLSSVWQSLSQGSKAFKGGDYWQVGGEFLIAGKDDVLFTHRMTNTRDHAEVPRVRQALGLDEAAVPLRKKRWTLTTTGLGRQGSISRGRSSSRRSSSRTKADTGKHETQRIEEDKENIKADSAVAV